MDWTISHSEVPALVWIGREPSTVLMISLWPGVGRLALVECGVRTVVGTRDESSNIYLSIC